jgi:acyl-coenzyme A thioesterase PaaI-like protein
VLTGALAEDLAGALAVRRSLPASHGCFVCGLDNPLGFRLRFAAEGSAVTTAVALPRHYNGFPAVAHGGILATLLDEAMGWAAVLAQNRFAYTAELTLRYEAPVPVEETLLIRAQVDRHNRRLAYARAELTAVNGVRLASATGTFAYVDETSSRTIAAGLLYDPGDWRLPSS